MTGVGTLDLFMGGVRQTVNDTEKESHLSSLK